MGLIQKGFERLKTLPEGFNSAFLGFIFGLWFIGIRNVFPWNLEWLNGKGDGSYAQLSFEFFRKSPLIQWPITAIPN